ncbi:MAG: glycosyltransferase [Gloeobacterales cyanobacterium]
MHILIATPYLPWPLASGGNVAQFSTLQCLSQDHLFTLVCPVYSQQQVDDAKELSNHLTNVRVKAVPCFISHPQWHLEIRNAFHGIRKFLRPQIAEVSLLPYYPFAPLPTAFIDVLSQEIDAGVDLLQVEFADMLSLGCWQHRKIPKLFIHHQIHWVYTRRYIATHESLPYCNYLEARMYAEEVSFLSTFDGIVVFSETDARELSGAIDPKIIHVSPFPIPADIEFVEKPTPISKSHFIFIGSEKHYPNQDALNWLLEDIWPLIRDSLPQARLSVIGSWSEAWRIAHETEGVDYSGFVEDLSAQIRGTIQLVPIRIGSGIRTKVLAAMAQGVPIVSTSVGIEGIKINDNEHLLIRDHAEMFASAAIKLAKDPELSAHLSHEALRVIQTQYSPDMVRRTRNEIYETVVHHAKLFDHLRQAPKKCHL